MLQICNICFGEFLHNVCSRSGKVPCWGRHGSGNVQGTEWKLGQLMCKSIPQLFILRGMGEQSQLTFLWKKKIKLKKKNHTSLE